MPSDMELQEKRKAALAEAGLPTEVVDDHIEQEDLQVPRVKLAQGSSKEVKDGTAKVGEFVNSVTGKSYGEEIIFLISQYIRQRIKFGEEGSAVFDCLSLDSKTGNVHGRCSECNYSSFVDEEGNKKPKGPECSLIHGFLGMVLSEKMDILDPCIMLSMSSTSTGTAKKILTTHKLSRPMRNLWERVWRIGSAKKEKGQYSWLQFTAQPSKFLDPENDKHIEVMKLGHELYQWSEGKKIAIEEGDEERAKSVPIEDENVEAPF